MKIYSWSYQHNCRCKKVAVEFLTGLFIKILESERMTIEWSRRVLFPLSENKRGGHSCRNSKNKADESHIKVIGQISRSQAEVRIEQQ